ncbi:carbohydrate esterase family 4 protein [Infundibulicybe gibba]|nr:carbohydrate esterase family 4 protein [Infundibulicybe gibba]
MFNFSALIVLGLVFVNAASAIPFTKRARAQVYTHCSVAGTAALTFDDGPNSYTNDIVDTLNAAGAKGTFFFNGRNLGCIYDAQQAARVKYAHDQGHQVASHTWSHADLTTLSRDQLASEITRTDQAITKITGSSPAFMRPPYGLVNNDVLDTVGDLGQSAVLWDLDSGDSVGASVDEQKNRFDAVSKAKPATILSLSHETSPTSAHEVLPFAIEKLQGAGYKLVTVAECLGLPAYKSTGSPASRDSSWTC